MYVTISIGNTDNKLTQQDWNLFVQHVDKVLQEDEGQIHFMGGASTWAPWQNVAWIVEYDGNLLTSDFIGRLDALRTRYGQDSIFVMVGRPIFLGLLEKL